MKKTLALLLTIIMFTGCFLTVPLTSQAAGGSCGKNVQWEYADGTLTISGTGSMNAYSNTNLPPWYNYMNDITRLVIEDGVKTIASLDSLEKVQEINIPNSVYEIDAYTFIGCCSLEKINLSNKLEFLGIKAFAGCTALKEFTINNSPNGKTNDILDRFGDITGYFFVRDGVLFSYSNRYYNNTLYSEDIDHFHLEKYPSGRENDTYIIPHDTMVIAEDAFSSLMYLNNIIVPVSVRSFNYLSVCGGLRDSDKPLNIIFQHNSYLNDMNHYAFHNLPKGSKIIVKNDSVKNQFIEKKSYYNYDYTGNENYVSIVTKNTPCQSLSVDKTDVKIKVGESVTVVPTQSPIITTDNVSFTSSNKKIASVDEYNFGNITGVNPGKTTITVTSGNAKAIVNVEVICEHLHKKTINVKNASCSTEGYSGDKICSDCGVVLEKGTSTPKKAHTLVDGEYKAPTCTTKGYQSYKHCKICDYKEKPTIYYSALGHNYQITTTKATVSTDGKIVKKCSNCGIVSSTTIIPKASSIKLSATSYIYDGNYKKPTVTVKDSKGNKISTANYSVTYSNNKNVGKASVKITFKGNYSGSKTFYFKINPKGTTISSLTATSKGFKVSWKKQAMQTTGYQIQYSTSSKFTNPKTVTVAKNSTTSKSISKLTAKKKYYVRVRTYKAVNGTKYYSAWSGYKYITTKK